MNTEPPSTGWTKMTTEDKIVDCLTKKNYKGALGGFIIMLLNSALKEKT